MKRFFLGLAVVAVALCIAAPAMADIKFTSKGYMDVKGIFLNKNILDSGAGDADKNESSNAYYKMKMIIEPTFHVNDKVRLHSKVTVMERYWRGGHGAENDTTGFGVTGGRGGNYRAEHNFWWEQLYVSFPVFDGTLSVGRMSGGAWAFPFQDSESNRDRIKYVRKVGNITLLGLIEKLGEGDGANPPWLTLNPATGDSFTNSFSDTDAYAVGAVVPFSKDIVWRPLVYYIHHEQAAAASSGYTLYISNALGFKMGPFFFDGELNYWNRKWDNFFNPGDLKGDQWAGWVDTGMNFGPAQFAVGGFYLQGQNKAAATPNNNGDKRRALSTTGEEFQPLLLLFSEDVGLLWSTSGVPNGSFEANSSGYQAFYARASYKLTDTMTFKGIYGYLKADKMVKANVSKTLGHEIDLCFEWKLMDNLTYVIEGGYLIAGKYFEEFPKAHGATTDLSNDVYGMRHMLVISW